MRARLLVVLLSLVVPTSTSALPSRPAGWPSTLELGMADGPGGAAAMRATGFGLRYQYLAGGVNTASALDHAALVTSYIQESIDHGLFPVFSYYMMTPCGPPSTWCSPSSAIGTRDSGSRCSGRGERRGGMPATSPATSGS